MSASEDISAAALEPTLQPDEGAVQTLYRSMLRHIYARTDQFFARLLLVQWLAGVLIAFMYTPTYGPAALGSVTPHVWMALGLGGLISFYPAWLGLRFSGHLSTRLIMAVAQMLTSSLLIDLTGGRIETHFHIFGSLAFLAFYRDYRVLAAAAAVIIADHLLRGSYWPSTVFGVGEASPYRALEHAGWVLFEITFLVISIKSSLQDIAQMAHKRVSLETINGEMERLVEERTSALRASEERFRALFENAPIGLYRARPDGQLEMANTTLLQTLGFESVAAMWMADVRFTGRGMNSPRVEMLRALNEREGLHTRDAQWKNAASEAIYLRETIRTLCDEAGEIMAIEGTVEDITDRRQLEERYMQSQKVQAIGQLAGGVAHDFNNILTAILGYSDLVLGKSELPPGARKHVSEIRRAGERAASLTQQLLAFSRKQTLQPQVFQLNSTVGEMNKMLLRLVGENVQIGLKLKTGLPNVKADPGQLQQVLMNLVVNGRDAMPEGGNITIETHAATIDESTIGLRQEVKPGSYVVLSVSDNGSGMSPEVQARIFEPFFTTKPVGVGTGLGLSTCHGIVQQSGGHMDVYSEMGHGTTIRVYLPITGEAVPQEARGETNGWHDAMDTHETVLLVEDEPMVRELGTLALTSLGYHVIAACNGVEALERIAVLGPESRLELVVTDVVMPEMGGRELAEQIRATHPGTRVLFSSGYTQDAISRTDLLDAGTFFLPKPYTMSVLARKVREVIDWQPAEETPV